MGDARKVDDIQTMDTIGKTFAHSGALIDPHTAVAVAAAQEEMSRGNKGSPMIALGCAHPAKFPDVVARATGIRPALPAALSDLFERRERLVRIDGRNVWPRPRQRAEASFIPGGR